MSKKKQPITIGDFHRMLVLAKWASGIFKTMSFEALAANLKSADEGRELKHGCTCRKILT